MKTIEVTPNYSVLLEQFTRDAMLHLNSFSQAGRKTLKRREVYAFVASFRIALGSIQTSGDVVKLQEAFDAAAEKMFAAVNQDREDADREWPHGQEGQ